ncbi:MAG: glucose-1-phosphate cytidylyltransferase [Pseudomonadota bacterium]
MKVVILAGGLGSRLAEETHVIPKPMVSVGDEPILWHIMKLYAKWGLNEFYVTLGYKGDVIKNYFLHYSELSGDLSVDLGNNTVKQTRKSHEKWNVHLIETGKETLTGGRLLRLKEILKGETFMLTYGDGVSDVNPHDVLELHHTRNALATVTAVRPPARFGGIAFDGDHVTGFAEKRQVDEGWINGGFMVMEPGVFDYLTGDQDVLEVDLLERLAIDKKLVAYKHKGYWQCMDTLRDRQKLEEQWASGNAPWKIWT